MRIVLHVDMDAFFASIEERAIPKFRGLPIVVGADPKAGRGRGVVSTCNYPARRYGIRSAMPISQAWRLSEEAARRGEVRASFLPVDGRFYGKVSARIMEYLKTTAEKFEGASVDEAYLEINSNYKKAEALAVKIKKDIKEKEGLTCSVGVGPNKLVAKIASDFNKPDGLTIVRPSDVQKFLAPMAIRKIPGIGPKTEAELIRKDIKTIRDLRLAGPRLVDWFGKWGEDLYWKSQGESLSPVSDEWERKSIGEQETFETDTLNGGFLISAMSGLCESVFETFGKSGFSSFGTVTATIRFANFVTKNRSHTLAAPAKNLNSLKAEAMKLLLPFLDSRANPKKYPIRLIGIRIEKIA